MQVQLITQMQMNGILSQQVVMNKNLVNGLFNLSKGINDVIRSLKLFAEGMKRGMEDSLAILTHNNALPELGGMKSVIGEVEDGMEGVYRQAEARTKKFIQKSTENIESLNLPSKDDKEKEAGGGFTDVFSDMKDKLKNFGEAFTNIIKPMVSPIENYKFGRDEGKGGVKGGLRNMFAAPTKALQPLGAALGPMAAMGPQMLLLMIVIKPLMAILQGLLEPFEPLMDVFTLMGELLGLIIVPVVNQITQALLFMMSGTVDLIPLLQEFALGLFQLMSPIIAAIARMSETGESFGDALISVIMDGIKMIVESTALIIPELVNLFIMIIDQLVSALPDMIENMAPAIEEALGSFAGVLVEASWNMVKNAADNFGRKVENWWNDLFD
jgi:hypothetical protein